MGNAFDFELHADDNATKALAEIEARLKGLQPVLNSTREGLRFGGSETLENTGALGNKLRDMSQSAKDNVQNIGDMIPPLKNFGELFTKYSGMTSTMGLFGGVGGIIGGLTAGYKTLREMGREANNLDTLSKDTAMSIEDTSKLTGALVQIGADADDAKKSVQNLFDVFNAAERGENGSARAELDKAGVKIHTTKDGSADVIPTLLELEEAFKNKNIPSETEKRLIVKLGLTPEILTLLREGKIQERLDKAKKYGQTITEEENQKLTDFNTEANESAARFSGMWNRTKIDTATWLLDKGEEAKKNPAWQTIKDIRMRENDTADSFYHGNKEEDIRKWAVSDKEFTSQLTFMEEFRLLRGKPDEELQKKLNDRYGESWEKQKKAHEAKTAANKIPALPKYEMPHYPNPYQKHGSIGTALLESMSDYFAMLEKKYGHEPGLLHGIAMTESSGNPNAIGPVTESGKQALGMFQFMPDTAKEQGLIGNDVFDPYKSAEAAAKYLSWLRQQTGNTDGMLAAYNWGIGKLQARGIRNMPAETRNYIPEVKKNMKVGAAIAEKNINSEQEQPFPSLYSQSKQAEYDEETTRRIAKAIEDAIGDKTITVDINLINKETGERQKFQSNSAGKVTTSMQYP
ncbi:lytic transglycosylase domain-containing protein [Xenorhabdus budapestensis]|uniref:Membrane-bound lytic murein transglycosylase D n=1 Tax=Xenorhabdus budapestensis TaxID=290110 RepID=A0A2D0IM79_XENBU|nr:lytic transglycosylase domain-containing protein [Xenorhabdus budapestensis]PHM22910.1 membrane-bound lytic murein transglycosylase D [Xenorhabdus budapestensis]